MKIYGCTQSLANLRAAHATVEMLVEHYFSSFKFDSVKDDIEHNYDGISVMLMQIENTLFDFLKEYDLVGNRNIEEARKYSDIERITEIATAG